MLALAFACLASTLSLGVAQPPMLVGLNIADARGRNRNPALLLPGEDDFTVRLNSTGAFIRFFNSWNVSINVSINGSQIVQNLAPNQTSGYCVDACLRARTGNLINVTDATSGATLLERTVGTTLLNWQGRFWDWNGFLQESDNYVYHARLENPNARAVNLTLKMASLDSSFYQIPDFTQVVGETWTLRVRRAAARGSWDWDSASPINSLIAPFQLFPYYLTVQTSGRRDIHNNEQVVAQGLFRGLSTNATYRCTFLTPGGHKFFTPERHAVSTSRFDCPTIPFDGLKNGELLLFDMQEKQQGSDFVPVYDVQNGHVFTFRDGSGSWFTTTRTAAIVAGGVGGLVVLVLLCRRCRQSEDSYTSLGG